MLFSLLVLVEVTLFYDETQAEFGIGLTLTIMLVMYTMYQSINESVSKTAYLKLIDYWLIFCLLVPFIIFLIETHWLLVKNRVNVGSGHQMKAVDVKKQREKKMIRILVPALTFAFIVFYFIIVIGLSSKQA